MLISLWSGPGLHGYMSNCLNPVLPVLQNEARQQKRGLWSDADRFPWIWNTVSKLDGNLISSSVLSGNKNGENKTGMAVSVTAMFISQYAGKIIHLKTETSLLNSERESFNSAADHRLAELITGKLYDRIPKRYGNM